MREQGGKRVSVLQMYRGGVTNDDNENISRNN